MKCPKCTTNWKRKDGMACRCGYVFLFDPKTEPNGMSDGKFQAILRSASAGGTYHFTVNQFQSHYARKLVKSPKVPLILFGVFLLAFIAMLFVDYPDKANFLWPLGLAAVAALIVGIYRVYAPPPDARPALAQLAKWQGSRGPLEFLVAEPQLDEPPPEWKEPDIYDYGVESILIVERDILVDLLVKNNFHSDQRTLIISEGGYPEYAATRARECLQKSPDLPVYLLHDSTRKGVAMKERLVRSGTLPLAGHPITDIGLFREDVKRLSRLRWRRPERHDYAVPVDCLAYGFLAFGLGQAVLEGMAFAQLIEKGQDPSSADSSGSFG